MRCVVIAYVNYAFVFGYVQIGFFITRLNYTRSVCSTNRSIKAKSSIKYHKSAIKKIMPSLFDQNVLKVIEKQ